MAPRFLFLILLILAVFSRNAAADTVYTIIYNSTTGVIAGVFPSGSNEPAIAALLATDLNLARLDGQSIPGWYDPDVLAERQAKVDGGTVVVPLDPGECRDQVRDRARAVLDLLITEFYSGGDLVLAIVDLTRVKHFELDFGMGTDFETRILQFWDNYQTVMSTIDSHQDPLSITDADLRAWLLAGVS